MPEIRMAIHVAQDRKAVAIEMRHTGNRIGSSSPLRQIFIEKLSLSLG
jgi:hypothetical protein